MTITARRLFTDIGSIEFPVITIGDNGKVTDINSDPVALAKEQDTLTAAFIDIHTHGAIGHDVMSASLAGMSEMQRYIALCGVAQYLPTTVTAPMGATLHSLEALADAIERAPQDDEAQPIGIHLEGPFLSHAKRGVHPAEELQPPSIELFEVFQQAARGHIRLVTIAPEPAAIPEGPGSMMPDVYRRSSAYELIRHCAQTGVKISLGHTNASAIEALTAIGAGATSATHSFNAMRNLDHREPGILGVLLDQENMYAELICDGVHVAPAVVRLWWKAKGRDRGILVTDSMSATGMPDGDYMLGDFPVAVANGRALLSEDLARGKETLAGSVLTMDRAVANFQQITGADLNDATKLASHNPAAMLGLRSMTRLAVGSPANINRFSCEGRLTQTYVRGKPIRH